MPRRPNVPRPNPQVYADCRALRHAWDPIGAGDRRPEFGTLVCLRCTRCGTLRYDKFSAMSGVRLAPPSYDYPPGYRDAEGGHDSAWWRATWAAGLDDALKVGDDVITPFRRRRRTA